jgi:hypothetical protein
MTIQNLGKIIFLVIFSINVFASNVNIKVSAPVIYKGDTVSFTITANSSDVVFPNISNIKGFRIFGTSSNSATYITNNGIEKQISKTYTFKPTKTITIPSFDIEVDGKILKTTATKISVVKPSQSKNGDEFIVELKVDKNNLKVGESTILRILIKRRLDSKANKLSMDDPKITNFWIKKIKGKNNYSQGDYIVQEADYLIFAQKAGNFNVDSMEVNIGKPNSRNINSFMNNPFFSSVNTGINWTKVYSNSLDIKVENLPNNIELYGNFNISASVDNTTVKQNKPINLTIHIDGAGNIDDIKQFNIDLDNAVIYANKPKVNSQLINNIYSGDFEQKIAIIANSDLTIPSFELTFFDNKTQQIKTIKTKPIDIKVIGGTLAQNQKPIVQKSKSKKENIKVVYEKQSDNLQYLYLLIGLIIGSIFTYLLLKVKTNVSTKKENDIIKLIKNTKDDKKLFDILLPYTNEHQDISDILRLLEENIYKKTNHKINKQKLYDIFL